MAWKCRNLYPAEAPFMRGAYEYLLLRGDFYHRAHYIFPRIRFYRLLPVARRAPVKYSMLAVLFPRPPCPFIKKQQQSLMFLLFKDAVRLKAFIDY